jgi:hypothetical protein
MMVSKSYFILSKNLALSLPIKPAMFDLSILYLIPPTYLKVYQMQRQTMLLLDA